MDHTKLDQVDLDFPRQELSVHGIVHIHNVNIATKFN